MARHLHVVAYWDAGPWSEQSELGYAMACTSPFVVVAWAAMLNVVREGKDRWHHWMTTSASTVIVPLAVLFVGWLSAGMMGAASSCNVMIGRGDMGGQPVEIWFCEQMLPYEGYVTVFPAGRRDRLYLVGYVDLGNLGVAHARDIDPAPAEPGRFRSRPRRGDPIGPGRVRLYFQDGTTREAALRDR